MLQTNIATQPCIDVTAVVVNYKTPDLTKRAIASVLTGSTDMFKEVIVVDNASYDGSVEKIREQWNSQITLIENEENLGFAKANNQAMRIAKGRYYFLLNSDAEIIDDSLSKMVRFADANRDIGILGCRIASSDGTQQYSCWRAYNLSYLLSRALYLYRILPDGWFGTTNIEVYGKPGRTQPVEVVSGCAMLVRREAAEKAGLFDEQFFMYCEDMDWCTRMRKAGYGVYFLFDALVLHKEGSSSGNILERMTVEQSRSVLRFMHKEYGFTKAILANIFLGLFFAVRLPYWILKLVAGRNKGNAKRMARTYAQAFCWHLLWPIFTR
jgi:hypothetical protein